MRFRLVEYGHWKPSKTAQREFAQKMKEIEDFCKKNDIYQSTSDDSYYFTINEQDYRVSNHTVEASNRHAYDDFGNKIRDEYHPEGEGNGTIYITAGKTRIIDIYNDLKAGYKLDRRGNRIQENYKNINESLNKIIAYHGSSKKFNRFDNSFMTSKNDLGIYGVGFYFTDNIDIAKDFSEGGYVYKCELTLKRPYIIKNEQELNKFLNTYFKKINDNSHNNYSNSNYYREQTDKIISDGYDGVIDYPGHNTSSSHGNWLQYVVYDASQIKILEVTPTNELIEKIIKKGTKYQVQSEKGKNLGTYNTREEAQKRLKQVEYFKHIKYKANYI